MNIKIYSLYLIYKNNPPQSSTVRIFSKKEIKTIKKYIFLCINTTAHTHGAIATNFYYKKTETKVAISNAIHHSHHHTPPLLLLLLKNHRHYLLPPLLTTRRRFYLKKVHSFVLLSLEPNETQCYDTCVGLIVVVLFVFIKYNNFKYTNRYFSIHHKN